MLGLRSVTIQKEVLHVRYLIPVVGALLAHHVDPTKDTQAEVVTEAMKAGLPAHLGQELATLIEQPGASSILGQLLAGLVQPPVNKAPVLAGLTEK
jgi:hypothetical protein